MKKYFGIVVGFFAGIIDVVPMLIQKLPIDECVSAFTMWVLIGFLISKTEIGLRGALKGLVIAYITIIPIAVLIGSKEPKTLIPVAMMTLILGSLSGFVIGKFRER